MSVAHCLEDYLYDAHVEYTVVSHAPTQTAFDSAHSAHIPTSKMVKAILLRERHSERYCMALIPASNKLKIAWVNGALKKDLVLAQEEEISSQFTDCEFGAIPGFGQAYDMEMIWDDELEQQSQLYFEAGSHKELIQIDNYEFGLLFEQYPHGVISMSHENYSALHADEVRDGLH